MSANEPIPALRPRGPGHQFVCYADSCSGVAGAPHEAIFAAINGVIQRLRPAPEFLCFPGDAVIGLTADDTILRAQWRHWFDHELAWLDRRTMPLYLTPGNHDIYDGASEAIWREVNADLPRNGPPGQEGMSYTVRRGDLALVFVNTVPQALGGEGRADVAWVERALDRVADARYKLVVGHHPVWPVNGFDGAWVRRLGSDDGAALWAALARHGVLAYLCSHMLAFDVQAREGVLQILTAGAGTAHRLPPDLEYLHLVQLAIDAAGLRYQVLDERGQRREWLSWPPALPPTADWPAFDPAAAEAQAAAPAPRLLAWRLTGIAASDGRGEGQTLLSGWPSGGGLAPLWIGLEGAEQRLVVLLSHQAGRSPARWTGPTLAPGQPFDYQLLLHAGLGPGGVLGRPSETAPWSTLPNAAVRGPDHLPRLAHWAVGHGQRGPADRPFRGRDARVTTHRTSVEDISQ